MTPDTEMFLAAFSGQHTFQTFYDKPGVYDQGKDPYARIIYDATQLKELNDQGAGIYLMINEGDGKGRKNKM